ncbi:MAG: ribonuclease H-like domain-containing protein [Bacteroidota bacterium]|nr:ribonuclease H-like domain-containing protein [Bacteroidota bacterium]
MFDKIKIEKILFLDIETAPQYANYNLLPERIKNFWDKKAKTIAKNDESAEELYKKAGIYSEFGKIITISFAYIRKNKENNNYLIVKSIYGDNEKEILHLFNKLLDTHFNSNINYLCAHNGKEFDFPYIARRSLVNGIKVANILYTPGAKPWEVNHLDTLELWKFGDYKKWISLDLLTTIFDIPSPKNEIDGSDVHRVYWEEKNINKIQEYCQRDVIALTQVFLKIAQKDIIPNELIFLK